MCTGIDYLEVGTVGYSYGPVSHLNDLLSRLELITAPGGGILVSCRHTGHPVGRDPGGLCIPKTLSARPERRMAVVLNETI